MSRNLCQRNCAQCPGDAEHIALEESPRTITKDEAGRYDGWTWVLEAGKRSTRIARLCAECAKAGA